MTFKQAKKKFTPLEHLTFEEADVFTMQHVGYAEGYGISPVAFSKPFQLFSGEAVEVMRQEVFDVRENHQEHIFSSNVAPCQLRGYASKYASFTYDAWTHPKTVAAVSKVAGIELVPWGNYEIAHINFSVTSDSEIQLQQPALDTSQMRVHNKVEYTENYRHKDGTTVVGWHRDSYPFVCILMLSDCGSMGGGETAVLKANGDIERIHNLAKGCAIVLQGRYITHKALRTLGNPERITSVTSFRPKSSFVRDDTVLSTVRPVSDLSELYFEFAEYRMAMLVDRLQAKLRSLRAENRAGKRTMVEFLKKFLTEQEHFIAHMNEEIVPYEMVPMGCLPEVALLDVPADLSDQHLPS